MSLGIFCLTLLSLLQRHPPQKLLRGSFLIWLPHEKNIRNLRLGRISKWLYFWTGSFPRVPGNTLAGGGEKKKQNGEKENKFIIQHSYSHPTVLSAIHLLASQQQVCKARKVHIKEITIWIWFQVSTLTGKETVRYWYYKVKGTENHLQFGDTCNPQDCNRIDRVLQRKNYIYLITNLLISLALAVYV